MLSISPIRGGASGASHYYLAEEKALHLPDTHIVQNEQTKNYYLKEIAAVNQTAWHGKIAEKEGILGQSISDTKLESVLMGKLDNQQVKGADTENRRNGHDLTFSLPKAASILALVYGDDRILDIHNAAVKNVLNEIEKDTAQYRTVDPKTRETTYHNSGNLLFGIVPHKTSRADEPQVHSHVLTANMTYDQDGELKNLASCKKQNEFEHHGTMERIYKNQKYYTSIYHSDIAKGFEKSGFQIESKGKGLIDIAGIPDDVIAANSTRSEQIKEHIDALGFDSSKARDIAAQTTRKAKTYTPEASLLAQWQAKNDALGFDGLAFVAAAKEGLHIAPTSPRSLPESATTAIDKSLSHLSANMSQLSYEAILTTAAHQFSYGKHHDMKDLKIILDAKIKEGHLIPLNESQSNNGKFTTAALIEKEKTVIAATQGRTSRAKTLAEPRSLEQLSLSAEHQKTVTALMESKKAINLCHVTGSSKDISSALLHVGNQSGRHVLFVTPNNQVKQQNQQSVKAQSFTVMQWVKNQFRQGKVENVHSYLNQPALTVKKGKQHLIVVEHANKLSLDQTQALVERTKAQGSKIIFLNQSKSRQGFSSGNAMETLQKGYVGVETWRGEKSNKTDLSLIEEVSKDGRKQRIAEQYAALPATERSQVAVLASSKRDAAQLNTLMRNALDRTGALSEQRIVIETFNPVFLSTEQKTMAKSYATGMRLTEFNKGQRPKTFLIESVNKEGNTLTLKNEKGASSTIKMDSAAATKRNFSIAEPGQLEVAAGERLKLNANLFKTELKQHDHVTVDKITNRAITLIGDDGVKHSLSPSTLHHAALSHGYASSMAQAQPKQPNIWVDMPSYIASKEVMHDLLSQNPKQLRIMTENTSKLEEHIGKSKIQPSTMSIVMQRENVIEKYVNAQTQHALFQDVGAAISNILERNAEKPVIEQAVNFAIGHVSEQKAGFSHADLVTQALRYTFEVLGTSVTNEEIKARLDIMKTDGHMLSAEYSDGTRWTTKEAIETESRILKRMEEGKNTTTPFVTAKEAANYLANNNWLSQGQRDGITLIATTPDRYVGIQGFAGTGKSTMLEQGITLIHQVQAMSANNPVKVIGLAPTHAAVNELKEKGVDSQTSQSLLRDFTHGAVDPKHYHNTLFLLDESSMTSNAQLDGFTKLVEQSGAKVAFLGDMYQLQSKEAGKPFELAFKRNAFHSIVMKDIKRQDSETLLAAVHQIVNKNPQSALDNLKKQPEFDPAQYHTPPKTAEHNVISTYKNTGNPMIDREVAKETLYASAVAEYLARTPASRKNTIMIAYTHRERDLLTVGVREGLKKTHELDSREYPLTRLRGVSASTEDLKTMMPYKQGNIICTGRDDYLLISYVDKQHGIVSVTDMHTGEEKMFIPKQHDHKMTTLWSSDQLPLAVGDEITWRKTDKELALEGNKPLKVESIDLGTATMTVSNEKGTLTTLDLTKMQSTHWDYRYTRTADMAQGATEENVITVISASANLTNIRRGYIDATRASQNVKLFTDNEATLINSWLNHHDNNASALETIEKTKPIHEQYFKDVSYSPTENPKYQQGGEFVYSLYGKDISQQLAPYTESLANKLLGQPNASKSDVDHLAFGQGDSHLKVSLTGEYRGYYRNWTTGDKGSLINLIMSTKDIGYKEAVTLAASYLADPEAANLTKNEHHDKLTDTLPKQVSKLKEWAVQYWDKGQELHNTIGQKYLENETGNNVYNLDNIKFHAKVYSSESRSTHPAVISKLSDNKDELQAIQITYLNEQGDKADLKVDTRLLGFKSGNSIKVHDGHNTDVSAITVGIETGIALKQNNPHDVDIITINNLNDARTVNTDSLRENIILITNGRDVENDKLINDITSKLEEKGHTVSIISQSKPENSDIIKTAINANDAINDITHIKTEHSDVIDKLVTDINHSDSRLIPDTEKEDIAKQDIELAKEEKHLLSDAAMREFEISKSTSSTPDINKDMEPDSRSMGELTR